MSKKFGLGKGLMLLFQKKQIVMKKLKINTLT